MAGLAGLSPSFLSMVESGQRPLDRRSHVAAVASALRISETDLVGGPHLSADREQADPHMAIPALREALQTNKLSCPAVETARPLPELAAEVTGRIEPLRADSDYAKAGSLLPDVLDELHWHTATATDEASRRLALETLIEACITAGLISKNLGYWDLAHVAALRAEQAAAVLGDRKGWTLADATGYAPYAQAHQIRVTGCPDGGCGELILRCSCGHSWNVEPGHTLAELGGLAVQHAGRT